MTNLDYLNLADEITDALEPLILDSPFHNDDVCGLAANISISIFELHIGVLTLLRSYADSHAVILIRTMQESFVNLQCLSEDANYINQIHYDDAQQNYDICKGMSEAYSPDSPEFSYLQEQLKILINAIEGHKQNGVEYKSLRKKFQMIAFPNEYAVYQLFCTYSHNNSSNLYRRHGRGKERDFAKELTVSDLKGVIKYSFIFLLRTARLTSIFGKASIVDVNQTIESASEKLKQFD